MDANNIDQDRTIRLEGGRILGYAAEILSSILS